MNELAGRRWILLSAALSGFLTVALGAFAAHGLKTVLDAEGLAVWSTAVRYQMLHGLVLFACYLLPRGRQERTLQFAAGCFVFGLILFCGSLYLFALSDITVFARLTPLGGIAFLIGWANLLRLAWWQN